MDCASYLSQACLWVGSCDSRERSADAESTFISEPAQSAEGGNKEGDPHEDLNHEKGDDDSNS